MENTPKRAPRNKPGKAPRALLSVRLRAKTLAQLNAYATRNGVTRSHAAASLIASALGETPATE